MQMQDAQIGGKEVQRARGIGHCTKHGTGIPAREGDHVVSQLDFMARHMRQMKTMKIETKPVTQRSLNMSVIIDSVGSGGQANDDNTPTPSNDPRTPENPVSMLHKIFEI